MSLSIENMSFSFPGMSEDFLHCSGLNIASGEKVFLQGASGSGKTTLLGLIGGVLLPNAGKITILNQVVNELSGSKRDTFRADHIGFIFQMFNLLPYLSVVDNVLLALKFSPRKRKALTTDERSEAARLLNSLGLSDPGILDRGVHALSVGQQQRVAVARALIGSPELIIADEPTSALDADTRQSFLDLLFEEVDRAGSTLIYVSHDQGMASSFDRTLFVRDFRPTIKV